MKNEDSAAENNPMTNNKAQIQIENEGNIKINDQSKSFGEGLKRDSPAGNLSLANNGKNANASNESQGRNPDRLKGRFVNSSFNTHSSESKVLSTLNQSRDTKNSSTIQDLKLHYKFLFGYGTSEFQSSSSLQHSIAATTFPKAPRFSERKQLRSSWADAQSQEYQEPSIMYKSIFKTTNGTSLGLGDKHFIPKYRLDYAASIPAPNLYNVVNPDKNNAVNSLPKMTATTFGAPREAYNKVANAYNHPTDENIPGPDKYFVTKKFELDKKGYSLRGKWELPAIDKENPACNYYTPKSDLVINSRFKQVTIGNQKRFPDKKELSPGPGSYNISTPFGKTDRLKIILDNNYNLN